VPPGIRGLSINRMTTGRLDAQALRELIAQVGRGNAAALEALYDQTSPILYGLLIRILKHPDRAQDALQECYLRVWRRAETYAAEKGDPLGWLIGIARYRALDLIQSTRKLDGPTQSISEAEYELPGHERTPEDAAVEQEGLLRLDRCLQSLQSQQRRSVLMAYYEGYSHSELALAMNAPLGTVKAWVRRGLARLRECLERP